MDFVQKYSKEICEERSRSIVYYVAKQNTSENISESIHISKHYSLHHFLSSVATNCLTVWDVSDAMAVKCT